MEVIFILILVSSVIAFTFVVAFIWSVKSGQYDDTYSPSVRILFDNQGKTSNDKKRNLKTKKCQKMASCNFLK